jgi:hypothetical protein
MDTWLEERSRRAAGQAQMMALKKAMHKVGLCPRCLEDGDLAWAGLWLWIMAVDPRAEHDGLMS